MSPELKDLLDDAARGPRRPLDVDGIHRRGRRRRAGQAIAAAAVVALVGTVAGVALLDADDPRTNVVVGPPTTTPTTGGETEFQGRGERLVGAEELGLDVLAVVDSTGEERSALLVTTPDGRSYTVPVDHPSPSLGAVVPDGAGGAFRQETGVAGGSPPVLHVDAGGDTTVVVAATPEAGETYRLVGAGDGSALVTHRIGGTPESANVELLEVRPDGTSAVLRDRVGGWESGLIGAGGIEILFLAQVAESQQTVLISPPDGPPAAVFEGEFGTGPQLIDVAATGRFGFALLEAGVTQYELLIVELDSGVADRVPVDLGPIVGDGEQIEATDLSAAGEHVLVNLRAGDRWLAPRVFDNTAGTWATLEGPAARSLLARPGPGPEPVASACSTEDAAFAEAPPEPGRLHRYVVCEGDAELARPYRLDLGPATGDPVADAETVLAALFGDLPDESRARGYRNLEPPAGLAYAVELDGADLELEFGVDDGFGGYSTSAGSAIWHALLGANLLQLDGVEQVRITLAGDCAAYTARFEGSGCAILDTVPWS